VLCAKREDRIVDDHLIVWFNDSRSSTAVEESQQRVDEIARLGTIQSRHGGRTSAARCVVMIHLHHNRPVTPAKKLGHINCDPRIILKCPHELCTERVPETCTGDPII